MSVRAAITSRAREALLVVGSGIGFALAFSYPIFGRLSEAGFHHDWDLLWQGHWVPYHTLWRFHQLPLWNPYKCGGIPLLGNPESRVLTPFFLLHLLFDPVVGLHLEIPLHLAIAWTGGYALARVQGLGPLGGVIAGSVFPASSWFYVRMAVGHVVFLSSSYLPWIAVLFWLGAAHRRLVFAAVAGLLVALTLGEGGVYPVPQALLLVVLMALTLAVSRRSLWPIAMAVVTIAFSFGFSAVKLLPAYALMSSHPRSVRMLGANSFGTLFAALLSRDQDCYRQNIGRFGFHEYGAYIGPLASVLAVIGIVSAPRRIVPWLVPGIAFLLLATGNFLGPASPWALLHRMPVFSSERAPSRFLIPFTLVVGVMAAFGAESLCKRPRRAGTALGCLLVGMLLIDFWYLGPPNLVHMFEGSEPVLPASPEFRQFAGQAGRNRMLAFAKANMGVVECYEYAILPTAVSGVDRPGYRGEQYLLGTGSLRISEWTPNALGYEVDAPRPTVMVVNQNYDGAWHLIEGEGRVFSENGLLAVRVPAGRQHLELVYRSPYFLIGLGITAVTFVAMLALRRLERDERSGPTILGRLAGNCARVLARSRPA